MPIIQSIRRINPLDLNKNVKIGVAFPLDEEKINVYIPDITLNDIFTQLSEDKHTLIISLTYTYLLDNSEESIQLNLYN